MNKVKLFLISIIALPNFVYGADWGLGISFSGNDSTIYVPVNISKSMFVEGNVSYIRDDQNFSTSQFENRILEIGFGLFGRSNITENLNLYYGGRIAYIDTDVFESTRQENFTKSSGYKVSPTLGFEYKLTKSISFSGEAEWFYSNNSETITTISSMQRVRTGTDTRFVARYFF